MNLNNTQVSTEDRFSLFKTDDVSIEAGTEVTDLLNPKGLVQTLIRSHPVIHPL